MRGRESDGWSVAFQALLLSATLDACASTGNDPVQGGAGGGAGSGGFPSLAGSRAANDATGGTNDATGGANDATGGVHDAWRGTLQRTWERHWVKPQ